MHITVGPFRYEIVVNQQPIRHPDGGDCHGLAWPDIHRIEFSMVAPAEKRLAVVWHEIGHLIKADLDIHDAGVMDEESMCNLIGLAMSMMSPMDLLRLHVFATQGIDAPSAMMCPGLPCPIPVFHFDRPL